MNVLTSFLAGLAVVVSGLALFIFTPILTFWFGFLGGIVLKFFVGAEFAMGLNLLFNTTRFTPEMIPLMCAVLAILGGFFKSSHTVNNKK